MELRKLLALLGVSAPMLFSSACGGVSLTDENVDAELDESRGVSTLISDDPIDGELAADNVLGAIPVSMQDLLANGVFLFDLDCRDGFGFANPSLTEGFKGMTTFTVQEDGYPAPASVPDECEMSYSVLSTGVESGEVLQERYTFDVANATWVLQEPAVNVDDNPSFYTLNDGQWLPASDTNMLLNVAFPDDGTAIFTTQQEDIRVDATENPLRNSAVVEALKDQGASYDLIDRVSTELTFDEISKAYTLHVNHNAEMIALFNWGAQEGGNESEQCIDFNGNCNVLRAGVDAGFEDYRTLVEIQYNSVDGILLENVTYDLDTQFGVDITLNADADSLTEMPVSGIVTWDLSRIPMITNKSTSDSSYEPSTSICYEFDSGYRSGSAIFNANDAFNNSANSDVNDVCVYRISELEIGSKGESLNQAYGITSSRWAIVVEDGVAMLEVEVPIEVKDRIGQNQLESLLLIEHNGFVRRGARYSNDSVDEKIVFNDPAFAALKTAITENASQ